MFLVVLGVVLLGTVVASANGLGVLGSYWDTADADSGWGIGAKYQLDAAPSICVELRGSYFPDFGDSDDESSLDIIPVEADAIYKLPIADRLTSYVGGGVGYYMFELDSDNDGVKVDVDDEFGWFALAGVEFILTEQLALFAEGKYTWLDVTAKASGDGVDASEDASLDGFGGNAGVMLRF
jgi:opacity protein-like surface antigen